MKYELQQTKAKLYSLLLQKDEDNLTENEAEIMCLLAKDVQVQQLFEANEKKS